MAVTYHQILLVLSQNLQMQPLECISTPIPHPPSLDSSMTPLTQQWAIFDPTFLLISSPPLQNLLHCVSPPHTKVLVPTRQFVPSALTSECFPDLPH